MLNEKDTIRCESVFNDDRTHRFLWKRVWDKEKPLACVITLNPSLSTNLIMDTTTFLIVNNVTRLEKYGGVVIVNLYSVLTTKLNFKEEDADSFNDPTNDTYIVKAAEECEAVILAWGRSADSNQHISERAVEVFNLLVPYENKLYVISDGVRFGIHPLTPSARNAWHVEKVSLSNMMEAE